jgi:hypothetical protein
MNAPLGAAPERIWLAVEAVDMRLGIDGLSARIQASLGRSPCDGTPTPLPTGDEAGSNCWSGMAPASGSRNAGCTVATSPGRAPATRFSPSLQRNGVG